MISDLQKANLLKRISAFILDAILVCILSVGFAFIIAGVVGYDSHNERLNDYYSSYEESYGIVFDISENEYNILTDDEKNKYNDAYNALVADEEVMYTYNMVVNLTLLITSLGIFFGLTALEFAVPLILKNGQTVGKKVFGIGVMRTDGIKLSPILLFIRSALGKYTIETMIPVLIIVMIYFNTIGLIGVLVLGLILLLQLIFIISTKTNSLIHDLLAGTVVVDMASQMIFDSEAALIEYTKKVHAEKAAREEYR